VTVPRGSNKLVKSSIYCVQIRLFLLYMTE